MSDYAAYVHECKREHAGGRWFVAAWSDAHAQYTIPLSAQERRLNPTGTAWYSRTCEGMPHYATRAQALRHARYVYGDRGK